MTFAWIAFILSLLVLAVLLLSVYADEVTATVSAVAGRISRAWTALLQLLYTPRVGGYRPRHIVRFGDAPWKS